MGQLDEPFNSLDAASSAQVHKMLRERQRQGLTIVFTSHNAEDFERLAPDVTLKIESRRLIETH